MPVHGPVLVLPPSNRLAPVAVAAPAPAVPAAAVDTCPYSSVSAVFFPLFFCFLEVLSSKSDLEKA
jgi:hypothetical protein